MKFETLNPKQIRISEFNNLILFSASCLVLGFMIWGQTTAMKSLAPSDELVYSETAVVGQQGIKGIEGIKSIGVIEAIQGLKTAPLPLPIVPPGVVQKVFPQYPSSALSDSIEGVTLLSVYVGLGGQPEQVQIKVPSGCPELDASAVAAVSQWRFSPATQGGTSLASWYEVPVRFVINN